MGMKAFYQMVDRYAATAPARREQVETAIWERYGVTRAVLALDMSSFTLSVRLDGLLPYLARIRHMHEVTGPITREYRGEVVKYQADNLLALFPDPPSALGAAFRMRDRMLQGPYTQSVGIGLSFGRVLFIPDWDAHGDAINIAFKLGEDVAVAGEILASSEFVTALGEVNAPRMEPRVVDIAGLKLDVHRILD